MKKIYIILLTTIMLISLGCTLHFPIEAIWPINNVLFVFIIIVALIGIFRLKDTLSKGILILSTIYYILTLLMTMTGKVDSLLLLIPLTVIPIFTTKALNHIGLANRMALAFWFVLSCLMVKTVLPFLSTTMMTCIVFISYFLQMTVIFFNESETYTIHGMIWKNPHRTNPNIDEHNATHFNRMN